MRILMTTVIFFCNRCPLRALQESSQTFRPMCAVAVCLCTYKTNWHALTLHLHLDVFHVASGYKIGSWFFDTLDVLKRYNCESVARAGM